MPPKRDDLVRLSDILGLHEVAEVLGIQRQSVDTLRHRGRLPEPDVIVSGRPLWKRSTIVEWNTARKES